MQEPPLPLVENLRRVRISRGLSQTELAARIGLSRIGYRNIEVGASTPKPETLRAIEAALGEAASELHLENEPRTLVRFRSPKPSQRRDELLARVFDQLDGIDFVERELMEPSPTPLPALEPRLRRVHGIERAKRGALLAREALGLGPDELVHDAAALLEAHGIHLLGVPLASDGYFGLSLREPATIVVNGWDRISVERRLFAAFHELGHLVLHPAAYDVTLAAEDAAETLEANVFAGYFLMPETRFEREVARTRGLGWYDQVFVLKRLFRVSYRAVLHRLAGALVASERARSYGRFAAEYKRRTGKPLPPVAAVQPANDAWFGRPVDRAAEEPERLGPHDFVPTRVARLVRTAFERNLLAVAEVGRMLGLDAKDTRDRVTAWKLHP